MSVQVSTAADQDSDHHRGSGQAGDRDAGAEPSVGRSIPDSVRRRLTAMPAWTWRSWAAAGWVVVIAAILRFVNLGLPNTMVFDEIYYATEGQELLDHGVEWRTETDSGGQVVGSHADFVVHPPLGKWIIGLGIKMFTNDAFGWRFMAAVVGIASVLIVIRVGRRMFHSTVLGCTAGLLMALDGMQFVLSRTAILDIFVLFFVLAAFACAVLDRDARRARWLRLMEQGLDPTQPGRAGRPRLAWSNWRTSVPWWRLAAGVMLGAGTAVKWSTIFFVPALMVLILLWEVGTRRIVGAAHPWRDALLDESGWIVLMALLVLPTYLASWTGWFLSDDGWKRHYLQSELGRREVPVFGALYNLWAYHVDMMNFHKGLSTPHQYQSWPWQWIILGRPVAFYWNSAPTCGAASCAAEIILLGTPVLWWAFVPALAAMTWFGISRRDWRALAIGLMVAAGIVPWFYWELKHRTMFYFYAAPAEPFLILAVVYVLGAMVNGPGVGRYGAGRVRTALAWPAQDRRLFTTIAAAGFVALVAVCFWWYYPLYVGNSIPYADWLHRMLLGNRWV